MHLGRDEILTTKLYESTLFMHSNIFRHFNQLKTSWLLIESPNVVLDDLNNGQNQNKR